MPSKLPSGNALVRLCSQLLRLRPGRPTFGPVQMVFAVAALLLGLFLYAGVQTASHTFRLQSEVDDLQVEVYDLRVQRAELEGLREYLRSDEYVEAVARAEFGLVRAGETAVVVDAAGDDHPERPTREPGQRWWEALFDR